jgi:signal recognition particle GTPase
MAVNTGAGEQGILLVIKNRRIIRVEAGAGINPADVTELTEEWKQNYSQSDYGCRPVHMIYQTKQTQSPEECFIIIGGVRIKVDCT